MSFGYLINLINGRDSRSTDLRLASAYTSYFIGRFLSFGGSILLLLGLVIKFIFLEDTTGPKHIISIVIASLGLVLFIFGASLIISSALRAQKAQKEELNRERTPTVNTLGTSINSEPGMSNIMYVSPPLTAIYNEQNQKF